MKKSEILTEALGNIKDEYIEEALADKPKNKTLRFKRVYGFASAAAVFAIIIAAAVYAVGRTNPVYPETDGPEQTATAVSTDRVDNTDKTPIIWGSSIHDSAVVEYVKPSRIERAFAEYPGCNYAVLIKRADILNTTEFDDRITGMLAGYEKAETDAAAKVVERLMSERGVGSREANALKFSDDEFIEAREEYFSKKTDIYREILKGRATRNSALIDKLKSDNLSQIVVCITDKLSCSAAEYFVNTDAVAIAIMDEDRIKAYMAENYEIDLAIQDYEEFEMSDFYTGSEIYLSGVGKLTETLYKMYESGDSKKIHVKVFLQLPPPEPDEFDILYPGDVRGAMWARALSRYGMTMEDFNNLRDGELIQEIIETKHSIQRRDDEYAALRAMIFRDGEEEEWNSYNAESHALVTYERAMELSTLPEVSYITSFVEPVKKIWSPPVEAE